MNSYTSGSLCRIGAFPRARELPRRDVEELVVVTQRLAVLGLGLGAEVAAAGLAPVQGVDAHELAQLEEVGHAARALEGLVEVLVDAGDLDVRPELVAQFADRADGVLEALFGALHAAVLPHDGAELLVEGVHRAGALDGEQLDPCVPDVLERLDDRRVVCVDLRERRLGQVVVDRVRQHEVAVREALHERRRTQPVRAVVGEVGLARHVQAR